MAFPVDAGRQGTNISTAADPISITYPASIAAGNLLILYLRTPAGTDIGTTPSGWIPIFADSSDASDDLTNVLAKQADGSETGSLSVDMGASTKAAAIMWRITGALVPPARVGLGGAYDQPDFSAATTTTGANINPGGFTPDNPGGSQDYLWLSIIGMDSETATASNGTLSNVANANSGTGGAVASNCMIWGGSIQSAAASIDIAAWTSTAPNSGASAFTLSVQPAAATALPPHKPERAFQAVNRSSVF